MRPLLACAEELNGFLLRTAADAARPKPVPQTLRDALRGGAYGSALRELASAYVTLEGAYLTRSVARALELDAPLPVRPGRPRCSHRRVPAANCGRASAVVLFAVPPCRTPPHSRSAAAPSPAAAAACGVTVSKHERYCNDWQACPTIGATLSPLRAA